MTAKETSSVSRIIEIFESNNTDAKVDFLKECPDSPVKATAEKYISQPDFELDLGGQLSMLSGINMLAATYSRGIDCNRGIALSKAVYDISQKALTTIFEKKLRDAYLFCAGYSLNNWIIGLNGLGLYRDSTKIGEQELIWLENRRYKESLEHQCILRLNLIEAYLGLAHGNDDREKKLLAKAETILNTSNWDRLEGAYKFKLSQLRQQYDRLVQDATNLPVSPDEKQELEEFNKDIEQNLHIFDKSLEKIREIAPEIAARLDDDIKESLKPVRQKPPQESSSPNFASAGEKAIANQNLMDRLSDFLSAYNFNNNPNEAQKIQLQKKIRNACLIFADPVKGYDQKSIQNSREQLEKACEIARQNNFIEDENDALWGLYLCYSRSKQEDLAIDALQLLRQNLESLRDRIVDPMKRAGIFTKFPYLFASLCQLLCRAGRSEELLNAIEGAKGRVLADKLTESRGEVVEDSTFSEPVKFLPELMQQVHAHYLSYFVDDESTYAVLVAKDGSIHSQEITLGRETLREWSQNFNPKHWGTTVVSGFSKTKIPNDFPDRLAILVSWLEPFAKSGSIKQEDHICYCPDEELHLVPLHYVTFLNEPLVKYVSLSRIHSASALVSILRQSPEYYSQAIAIRVPFQQEKESRDEKIEMKLNQFARSPNWLLNNFSTQLLKDETADLQTLSELDLRYNLIHFSTHGTFPEEGRMFSGQEANPYQGSGLLLSVDGELPDRTNLYRAGNPNLLTPEKALKLDFLGSHISMMACVSGLSKEGIGGDALGLEWAFLLSGAKSLLSTHWNVDATAAAEFSLRFYDKWLNQHFPRYAAWRETVLELMNYQWLSDEHCSAYYWAVFSLSGDWR